MSHECAWANFFVSKEVLCDFIMDARFPGDTLFIVMEEDYRFWPAGEDPQGCDNYHERLQQLLQEEDDMRRSGAYRPDEEDFSVEAGGEGEHAKGRGRGIRLAGKYHHTPVRASTTLSDPNHGLQQEVADLIRMATFASRQNQGEIIWFGWDGSNQQARSWPTKGSHGLMVTQHGANTIKVGMRDNRIYRDHIDLTLLQYLRKPLNAFNAKACYLWPAVGSYFRHPSECDPFQFGADKGGRPAGWNVASRPAKGTRMADDTRGRWKCLGQWNGKGKTGTGRYWTYFPDDATLHSDAYLWFTYGDRTITAYADPAVQLRRPLQGGFGEQASADPKKERRRKKKEFERRKRIARQWKLRERLRYWTDDPEEAAGPIVCMSCLFPLSQPHTFHFTALAITAPLILLSQSTTTDQLTVSNDGHEVSS